MQYGEPELDEHQLYPLPRPVQLLCVVQAQVLPVLQVLVLLQDDELA